MKQISRGRAVSARQTGDVGVAKRKGVVGRVRLSEKQGRWVLWLIAFISVSCGGLYVYISSSSAAYS